MANLEILDPFQKLYRLLGDFIAATFQTIVGILMQMRKR